MSHYHNGFEERVQPNCASRLYVEYMAEGKVMAEPLYNGTFCFAFPIFIVIASVLLGAGTGIVYGAWVLFKWMVAMAI